MGRIGSLKLPSGKIETPAVLPVINPNKLIIPPRKMEKMGCEIIITNSYIIYKSEELRRKAKNLHSLLGWKKPIMTDSGAYQLSVYGDIDVDNETIVGFQDKIGADIGVPLDLPTPPSASRKKAKEELKETIRRIEEAKKIIKRMVICAPLQGGRWLDLRKFAAEKIDSEIYAVGGIVPLLDSYKYVELVDVILACKSKLPPSAPVHLFGAGHPLTFALSVALGCDLFDSAAYALYAEDGRYMTEYGTFKVKELENLPCSCPVCSKFSPKELDEKLLAEHNLWVTFEEIKLIKQCIKNGNLWGLVELRCRSAPSLLEGLKRALSYVELLEKYHPSTGKFFYSGPESCYRVEVKRYSDRLSRFHITGKVLITTGKAKKGYDWVFFIKPPFGPYPEELGETYPIGQSEVIAEDESRRVALQNVLKLLKLHDAEFIFEYGREWEPFIPDEMRKYAKVRPILSPE
jgi:7-cyano-7-deazaguanine tRNA-ribosyltransferase